MSDEIKKEPERLSKRKCLKKCFPITLQNSQTSSNYWNLARVKNPSKNKWVQHLEAWATKYFSSILVVKPLPRPNCFFSFPEYAHFHIRSKTQMEFHISLLYTVALALKIPHSKCLLASLPKFPGGINEQLLGSGLRGLWHPHLPTLYIWE